jgi:hypothetical protein
MFDDGRWRVQTNPNGVLHACTELSSRYGYFYVHSRHLRFTSLQAEDLDRYGVQMASSSVSLQAD